MSLDGFRFDFSRIEVTRARLQKLGHMPCCRAYHKSILEKSELEYIGS
jgi:hypothetical protein